MPHPENARIVEWKLVPAEPGSDAATALIVDGVDTNIAIQHCLYAGGYAVNEIEEEPELVMTHLGERKTLQAAKELALLTFHKRAAK